MLNRALIAGLVYAAMVAGCASSANEERETAPDAGSTGEVCIEGNNCEEEVACEDPTVALNSVEPAEMDHHDATARGQRCLDCHDGQPHAELNNQEIPQFDVGGRVVDPITGAGRPNVLVRMPSTEGGIAMRTNIHGYFWWPPPGSYRKGSGEEGDGETLTNRPMFPSVVSVGTDGNMKTMCAKAANGNCGSCHDGTITAQLH